MAYPDAVELAFADEVNAGIFEKIYDKQNRYVGSKRKPLVGSPAYETINTWRIERENGFMRQVNRRLTRKTNAFSKRLTFHERQIAIQVLHRNYCWVPHPRRPRGGSGPWEKQVTGAMAAGLTERIWTEEEIIERTDEFLATREVVEPLGVEQGAMIRVSALSGSVIAHITTEPGSTPERARLSVEPFGTARGQQEGRVAQLPDTEGGGRRSRSA